MKSGEKEIAKLYADLYKRVRELNDEQEAIKYILKNPYIYKLGDKVDKDWIVTDRCVKGKTENGISWHYTSYTLVNVKSGVTKTINN